MDKDSTSLGSDSRPTPSTQLARADFLGALRALSDFLPDALLAVDRDGVILLAGGVVEDLLGWDPRELEGQPLDVLLPGDAHGLHAEHFAHFVQQGQPRLMRDGHGIRGVRRDGTLVTLEVALSRVEVSGGEVVSMAFVRGGDAAWREAHGGSAPQ